HLYLCFFFFQCSRIPRVLHSFPTDALPISMHCGFAFLQTPIRLGGEERIPIRIGDVFAGVVLADDRERLLGLAEVNFDLNAIRGDRKSTRLNSSHLGISYAVFCVPKKMT